LNARIEAAPATPSTIPIARVDLHDCDAGTGSLDRELLEAVTFEGARAECVD
jgi:hypothetical protein